MSPFSITVENVPDQEVGTILTLLGEAGFAHPLIERQSSNGSSRSLAGPPPVGSADLPTDWRVLRERPHDAYQWSKRRDEYAPYRVFAGTTRAEGTVHIGLGRTIRSNAWGRDRSYLVAFKSSGSPQNPVAEFVAADDHEQTGELLAVIRGSDGGRRMYDAGENLPAIYAQRFRTQLYSERILHPGVYNKIVVVAREDDDDAILNHALIQSRRRPRG